MMINMIQLTKLVLLFIGLGDARPSSECAPMWSEEWTLLMGQTFIKLAENPDRKFTRLASPCVPVFGRLNCTRTGNPNDEELCHIGTFAQKKYKGDMESGSHNKRCEITFRKITTNGYNRILGENFQNKCTLLTDEIGITAPPATISSTIETCSLECLNGVCQSNKSRLTTTETCRCNIGYIYNDQTKTCDPIKKTSTTSTTTTTTTTSTTLAKNKCSLECKNGKCVTKSYLFSSYEECECDVGYSYSKKTKECELVVVVPSVVPITTSTTFTSTTSTSTTSTSTTSTSTTSTSTTSTSTSTTSTSTTSTSTTSTSTSTTTTTSISTTALTCSLECENGKCLVERGMMYNTESCECNAGFVYSSVEKKCRELIMPSVVPITKTTQQTIAEKDCSLECENGQCAKTVPTWMWSKSEEFCQCNSGYAYHAATKKCTVVTWTAWSECDCDDNLPQKSRSCDPKLSQSCEGISDEEQPCSDDEIMLCPDSDGSGDFYSGGDNTDDADYDSLPGDNDDTSDEFPAFPKNDDFDDAFEEDPFGDDMFKDDIFVDEMSDFFHDDLFSRHKRQRHKREIDELAEFNPYT